MQYSGKGLCIPKGCIVPESFGERAIGIGGDMAKAIADIRESVL